MWSVSKSSDWSDEGWNHPDDPSILKRNLAILAAFTCL